MLFRSPANQGDIRDTGWIPELGRSPGVGNGNPAPVFLPGKFHGQRGLVGYSPWSLKEVDMTEWPTHFVYIKFDILLRHPGGDVG